MSGKKTNGSEIWDWVVILFFISVFWPLGVYLLFRKLMGYGKSVKKSSFVSRSSEYHYTAQQLKTARKGSQTGLDPVQAQLKGGTIMTAVGGVAAAAFGIGGVSKLLEYLSWGGLRYAWSELFVLFGFFAAGLVVLYAGLARTRKGRRFQKYLNTIGRQKQISVSTLAGATGHSVRKVCDELDEMLERGFFPVGHLDRASGTLYLTDEGAREPVKEQPKPQAEDEYAILREIRAVNDAIPDEVMSAKIDHIEDITKKILDYQKQNPGRDSELRSFLDYYLPTTLKILRSYAQLDAQGIQGENISAAKARIEGMMDKVVEGFEKQLDRLFQTDTLDITTDVEVLEQMLKKDGLSGKEEGFQLKL